jgi:hypothetical protein
MRAARAQMAGRFEHHRRHLVEARRLAEATGEPSALLAVRGSEVQARRMRGERGDADTTDILPVFEPIPGAAALLTIPQVPGREAEVRAAFAAAPEASLAGWVAFTGLGVRLADAALFAGDPAWLAKLYGWLAPHAARNGTWGGVGLCCEGPVSRWLCQLSGIPLAKVRVMRDVSGSFFGLTGAHRSFMPACSGVLPPLRWLQ